MDIYTSQNNIDFDFSQSLEMPMYKSTTSGKRKYSGSKEYPKKRTRSEFTRNVKAVLSSLAEDKMAFTSSANALVMFNSAVDSAGDMIQILPGISQGTGDSNRIGDQIRAKSFNVKGYVKLNFNDVPDSLKLPNVICRLMVVSMKSRPSYIDAAASSATLATLLKKGGTTTGFGGLLSDIYAPINTDAFTVHHDEHFYLNQSFINAVGVSAPSAYITQDISKTVKFFNINIKCKNRLLRYDEDVGSNILPSNFGPMLLLGYSYLDGSSPDTLSTNVGLEYASTLAFEDA